VREGPLPSRTIGGNRNDTTDNLRSTAGNWFAYGNPGIRLDVWVGEMMETITPDPLSITILFVVILAWGYFMVQAARKHHR